MPRIISHHTIDVFGTQQAAFKSQTMNTQIFRCTGTPLLAHCATGLTGAALTLRGVIKGSYAREN